MKGYKQKEINRLPIPIYHFHVHTTNLKCRLSTFNSLKCYYALCTVLYCTVLKCTDKYWCLFYKNQSSFIKLLPLQSQPNVIVAEVVGGKTWRRYRLSRWTSKNNFHMKCLCLKRGPWQENSFTVQFNLFHSITRD